MTYFTQASSRHLKGGMDGHTEVIHGQQRPWLMENKAVALCADARMAEHIATLLRKHPFNPDIAFGASQREKEGR